MSRPIPLRPDFDSLNAASVRSLARTVIATSLAALDKNTRPSDHARRYDDRDLNLILRAAVSPHSLSNSPQMAQVRVAFLDALRPMSAGAALLARGVGLNFAGAAQINVPSVSVPYAQFVGEGKTIPVTQGLTKAGLTLLPCKLAT